MGAHEEARAETDREATDPFDIPAPTAKQRERQAKLAAGSGRAELTEAGAGALAHEPSEESPTGLLLRLLRRVKTLEELLRRGAGFVTANERRTELELAEGVEPIDRLHAARREAVGRLAVLEAKYETWDARRKNHRQGVATAIGLEIEKQEQAEYEAERAKWIEDRKENPKAKEPTLPKGRSEAELERLAGSDPRCIRLLDEAEEWLAELFITRNEVAEYDEIVNRDQAVLRLRAREREL